MIYKKGLELIYKTHLITLETSTRNEEFLQKRKLHRQRRIESSKYQFEINEFEETDLQASSTSNSSVKLSTDRKVSTPFSLFSVLKSPPLLKRQDGSSAFFTPAPVNVDHDAIGASQRQLEGKNV